MTKQGSIVVVDDNKAILTALQMLLNTCFNKVFTLASPNTLLATLEKEAVDVVLMDMNFSAGINNGNEGLYWLGAVKKQFSSIEVVLFTAYADIDLAVKGIKEGATDFVVKPWNNAKLIATLQTAYNLSKSRREVKQLKDIKRELTPATSMYWGESEAMRQLHSLITKVAGTDANVLITGENGTGKEILAREIHTLSKRKDELLVCVDMGAITETLFESELFGHVRGAFTDAKSERTGKFEVASNGTLFLDEIGNLPFHLQAKLLTVLQNRSIIKVGSNTPVPVSIRLICATNRNPQEMVSREQFREDLLYRINTIHIEIPPLRERKEDILPLATLFLNKYTTRYNKPEMKINAEACAKLVEYPWYGNIRELEHAIEKAVIISDGHTLESSAFTMPRKQDIPETAVSTLEDMEVNMIRKAMQKHEGNLSAVAAGLGISRQTLYNKMKKYEI